MTNKELAATFQKLADLMELHGENPFKIRSYENAYRTLRSWEQPLSEMSDQEMASIKGVGKAIAEKIRELLNTGQMQTLEKYKGQTPEGVQDMLSVKGFGPKKIMAIWKEMGIESVGELLYAINENRLVELKGFGAKTQEDLRQKLTYFQSSRHQCLFAAGEQDALALQELLAGFFPGASLSTTGALRRRSNILESLDFLLAIEPQEAARLQGCDFLQEVSIKEGRVEARFGDNHRLVIIYWCHPEDFGSKLFRYTAHPDFLQAFVQRYEGIDFKHAATEQAVFDKAGLPYVEPELREQDWALNLAAAGRLPQLIEPTDIKGVVHAHSTYSDGGASLRDMALHSQALGYEYLVITDHSKSAFYANGLKPERVLEQWEEIATLNRELAPFHIFKGIESDILADGSLDYEEALLQGFDLIIASIHSNLRMDEEKATQRLFRAIENPYTRILGHPTGRLLLSRPGYPIDHARVIDACAAHGVAIELNANPYRLDLDWTWIPYALEQGVQIAINPDAHSKAGIADIRYGVYSARKGGLSAQQCLNALSLDGFKNWLAK
ncbi:MAG TPA: helix-hairpin-helix domain-containing protein [Saprospiraceae bacterium]|nr:helix-hairpin-helix domain-containing protein [Saprospiraceae bacterium]HMQ84146.1 helix-hairpin-helix domain-containing protein [Saprospiraceae bacterium]